MNYLRMKKDFKYILLNFVINRIPCWHIRRGLYRALGMQIAKTARIGIRTVVDEPRKIKIGERTTVNEFCHLDGRGGLEIGDDVSLSVYTKIVTSSHHKNSSTFAYYEGGVKIGNGVWVGIDAIILDRSQIGDYAIIGAGCVFKGTAEEKSIYVGNPAVRKGTRELEQPYQLDYHPYFR